MKVYLNGDFVPHAEARVPVDDRGFLFADGVYEVIRVYGGEPFLMDAHLARLRDGLRTLHIGFDGVDELDDVARRLLADNGLDGDAAIYIQVTRGAAPRRHAFPDPPCEPTVYLAARPYTPHPDTMFSEGVAAITVSDTRWTRCDVKSISLLPNVLANQEAHARGAFEAIFVRDGVLLEGSHANLFGLVDGELRTYPATNYILPGITRALVLEIAREMGLAVREAPLFADRFDAIEELFLSGTTTEVMPIARVDGRPVGGGGAGELTLRLQRAFRERIPGA